MGEFTFYNHLTNAFYEMKPLEFQRMLEIIKVLSVAINALHSGSADGQSDPPAD